MEILQTERGQPVPALERKPDLHEDLNDVWDAFWELSSSRAIGFGAIGYIPITEILAMAELMQIDDRQEFVDLIRSMDRVYVEHFAEKQRRKQTERNKMDLAKLQIVVDAQDADGQVRRLTNSLDKVDPSAAKAASSVGKFRAALNLLKFALSGFGLTIFVKSILDAQIALERIRNTLFAVGGSAAVASGELEFLRGETHRIGIDLREAATAYSKFAAATKETAVQGEFTREAFTAVSEASRTLGLDAMATGRVFLALEQMVSKGTISMEELRRQLGNALPGAFQIGARAMGVTTAELGKMVQAGQLASATFLPAFIAQLRKEMPLTADAARSLQANMTRLKNAWFEFKAGIGETGLGEGLGMAFSGLATALDFLRTKFINISFLAVQVWRVIGEGWIGTKTGILMGAEGIVTGFAVAWEEIKKGWSSVTVFMQTVWDHAIGGIKSTMAGLTTGFARALDFIPGMGKHAESLRNTGAELTKGNPKLGFGDDLSLRLKDRLKAHEQSQQFSLMAYDARLMELSLQQATELGDFRKNADEADAYIVSKMLGLGDKSLMPQGKGALGADDPTAKQVKSMVQLSKILIDAQIEQMSHFDQMRAKSAQFYTETMADIVTLTASTGDWTKGLFATVEVTRLLGVQLEKIAQFEALRKVSFGDLVGRRGLARSGKLTGDIDRDKELFQAAEEELSRRFQIGAVSPGDALKFGFSDVAEQWGNTAQKMAEIGSSTANSLADNFTDAFTSMISGTKDVGQAFSEMAMAIAADILKLGIRKLLVETMLGGLGSLGGAFGAAAGGAAGSGLSSAGGFSTSMPSMHGGGVVGMESSFRRASGADWIGAPRFHSGGITGGDVPIIAKPGETIFTPEQLSALGKVIAQNQSGGKSEPTQIANFIDPGQLAEFISANPGVIVNIIGQHKSQIRRILS